MPYCPLRCQRRLLRRCFLSVHASSPQRTVTISSFPLLHHVHGDPLTGSSGSLAEIQICRMVDSGFTDNKPEQLGCIIWP